MNPDSSKRPSGRTVVVAFAIAIAAALGLVVVALIGRSDSSAPTTATPVVDLSGIPQVDSVLGSADATVTLVDEEEKKVRYQLVGQVEADARDGRISYNSPLGRALIGREVGDEVEVSTPSGDRYYQIKKIEFV